MPGSVYSYVFAALGITLVPVCLLADAPTWWKTQAVLTAGATADDYAAANIGQLKAIATKAAAELNADLSGGAGTALNTFIASWVQVPAGGVNRDDYVAINQGELKAVAMLFYDRLALVGYTGQPLASGQKYPWTVVTTDDDNYALVNLGQIKCVFSFIPAWNAGPNPLADSNGDGIPDAWEMFYYGTLTIPGGVNYSTQDQLSAKDAYALGVNPLLNYSKLTGGESTFHYTQNNELTDQSPISGNPVSYAPDSEGNVGASN